MSEDKQRTDDTFLYFFKHLRMSGCAIAFVYLCTFLVYVILNQLNPLCATGNLCFLVLNHNEESVCISARLRKPVSALQKYTRNNY